MPRLFSLYLDAVRIFAALLVFVSHVPNFIGGHLWQFAYWGHEAVVIFFILSGFVMRYVVYDKKESARVYVVNRITRIYSVALPALLLSIFVYYIGVLIQPDALSQAINKMADPVETTIRAITFTTQSWQAYSVFTNFPYWSMSYEVLYYLFFGIVCYIKPGWVKIILLIGATLLMGPTVLLYLPLWWAGVWLHEYKDRFSFPTVFYKAMACFSIVAIILLSLNSIQKPIIEYTLLLIDPDHRWLLSPGEHVLVDYLLTIAVFAHFLSMYHLLKAADNWCLSERVENMIRWGSSHTFALYLLHMPLLYLMAILMPYKSSPAVAAILCLLVTPLIIIAISRAIEARRKGWSRALYTFLVRR